jgi:hypothetical protein
VQAAAKVCVRLRDRKRDCVCACSHSSHAKVSIMVIGPWCGSRTPEKKRQRATKLDEAFMQPNAARRGGAVSWTDYVSLRDCATAEAKDGSHFTPKGAGTILGISLEHKILEFITKYE